MKIKKLENKEVKIVAGQKNCTAAGHSIYSELCKKVTLNAR